MALACAHDKDTRALVAELVRGEFRDMHGPTLTFAQARAESEEQRAGDKKRGRRKFPGAL
jgi:hypothetical protein